MHTATSMELKNAEDVKLTGHMQFRDHLEVSGKGIFIQGAKDMSTIKVIATLPEGVALHMAKKIIHIFIQVIVGGLITTTTVFGRVDGTNLSLEGPMSLGVNVKQLDIPEIRFYVPAPSAFIFENQPKKVKLANIPNYGSLKIVKIPKVQCVVTIGGYHPAGMGMSMPQASEAEYPLIPVDGNGKIVKPCVPGEDCASVQEAASKILSIVYGVYSSPRGLVMNENVTFKGDNKSRQRQFFHSHDELMNIFDKDALVNREDFKIVPKTENKMDVFYMYFCYLNMCTYKRWEHLEVDEKMPLDYEYHLKKNTSSNENKKLFEHEEYIEIARTGSWKELKSSGVHFAKSGTAEWMCFVRKWMQYCYRISDDIQYSRQSIQQFNTLKDNNMDDFLNSSNRFSLFFLISLNWF